MEDPNGAPSMNESGAAGNPAAPKPAQPVAASDPAAGVGAISRMAASAGKSMFPGVRAVLSQSGQDIAGSTTIRDAVGHTVRGAGALIPAVADDVVGQPLRELVLPAGGAILDTAYTAATGQSTAGRGPISTAAAAAPTAATTAGTAPAAPNPTDQRLGAGVQQAPQAQPSSVGMGGGPAGNPVPGAAGAYRFVDPSGRVLYTNVPGAQMPSTGQPTAGAQAAAQALSDRYGAEARGTISRLAAREQQGAAPVTVVGTQAVAERNERNGRFDEEVLRGRAESAIRLLPGRRGIAAGTIYNLAADNIANRRQQAATEAGRQATEISRTQMTEAGQDRRSSADNAGRLQQELVRAAAGAELRGAQTQEARARTQLAISTLSAQDAYAQAVASGDPKKVMEAEQRLRALTGKFQEPERPFAVQGGQVMTTQGAITVPSKVFDPNTNQFIEPPATKANSAALPPKDQLVKGTI